MIIEFNGLPGTGKSTVANEIEQLLPQGTPVFSRYVAKQSRVSGYISYLFDGSITLYFLSLAFAKKASSGNYKQKKKTAPLLVHFYRMYRQFQAHEPKDAVLLIDQGVLQAFISIAHEHRITRTKELDKIFRFLSKKGISFAVVSCENNIPLSMERIVSRNTTGGRLDVCTESERKDILQAQAENFELVRQHATLIAPNTSTVFIDTENTPSDNAKKILSALHLMEGPDEKAL